ncbi:MAG: hypothetical protein ACYSVY_28430, partial [Planctomycetota bacterium]
DQGTLNSWSLRLGPVGTGCPTLQLAYAFTMDSDPGWTADGQWDWGEPAGGGGEYGSPDPASGYTGNHVYGYNLGGDYPNDMPEHHLTSAPIDCSESIDTVLRYWRWIGVQDPNDDLASVSVSNDGTNWVTMWTNSGRMQESSWTQHAIDISGVADGHPSVYLRWTMGPTDEAIRFCGWNIDDIEVWGLLRVGTVSRLRFRSQRLRHGKRP